MRKVEIMDPDLFRRNKGLEGEARKELEGYGIGVGSFRIYEAEREEVDSNPPPIEVERAYYENEHLMVKGHAASFCRDSGNVILYTDVIERNAVMCLMDNYTGLKASAGHELVHKWQLEDGIKEEELRGFREGLTNKLKELWPHITSLEKVDVLDVLKIRKHLITDPMSVIHDGLSMKYGKGEYRKFMIRKGMEELDKKYWTRFYKELGEMENVIIKRYENEPEYRGIIDHPVLKKMDSNEALLKENRCIEVFPSLLEAQHLPDELMERANGNRWLRFRKAKDFSPKYTDFLANQPSERREIGEALVLLGRLEKQGLSKDEAMRALMPLGLPSNMRRYAKKNRGTLLDGIMHDKGQFREFAGIARKVGDTAQTVEEYLKSRSL